MFAKKYIFRFVSSMVDGLVHMFLPIVFQSEVVKDLRHKFNEWVQKVEVVSKFFVENLRKLLGFLT